MGWWGNGIMQGDSPLDILDAMREEMPEVGRGPRAGSWHPEEFPDSPRLAARFRAAFEAFLPKAAEWSARFDYGDGFDESGLAIQVLAVCALAAGADIDGPCGGDGRSFRAVALDVTRRAEKEHEAESPGWASSFKAFAAALEGYRGEPAYIGGGGLMEAFEEHVGDGLINVDGPRH